MSTQIVFIITHPLKANTACAAIKLVQQIINGRSASTALRALEARTQHPGTIISQGNTWDAYLCEHEFLWL